VTTNDRTRRLSEPIHGAFRFTMLVFALLLGAQCGLSTYEDLVFDQTTSRQILP
jgi:hypothetical protein